MVEIREAEPGDSEELWEIRRTAVQSISPGHYADEQIEAWSLRGDLPDFPYDDPTQYLPVALHGDRIVGFGGAGLEEGEIKALYSRPDTNLNVGSTLLGQMETVLEEEGVDQIVLDASVNSVSFYQRYGYTRQESVTHENHGVELEFVRMTKELDA